MAPSLPINMISGVALRPIVDSHLSRIFVEDVEQRKNLSWDRYVRLEACACAIRSLVSPPSKILDVGGYDGALALFLPEYDIYLVDPATTGASFFDADLKSMNFELLAAVDVLEHIEPQKRERFLEELNKSCEKFLVLNYPSAGTLAAQELAYRATGNQLLKEHVEWSLPDSDWVIDILQGYGFNCQLKSYASLAVWVGQYVCSQLNSSVAAGLNRYLVDNHAQEPASQALYDLLIAQR